MCENEVIYYVEADEMNQEDSKDRLMHYRH